MDSPTLVSQLQGVGLWPEDEAARRQILDLGRRFPEARDLARELIHLNLLTPYQANQLLTGKGSTLAIGPYLVLERLGEGGMGQVFKARQKRLHRVVALKVIRPDRVTNATAVGRFHREIQAAAKLSHPNVVRAYDADRSDDTYYFAMQFVNGTDLSRLVKQRGPLPVDQACDFIYQAAHGLQHIHANGMVHRDVKPSNLMITGPGAPRITPDPISGIGVSDQVKILDLGLARLCEDTDEQGQRRPALTQLGSVMGTADYMAPEQGVDSRRADARSDVYSLGCTLYFALAGRPPFFGETALEKLMHHQLDEAEPVEQVRPAVPPELAAVVRKLMARKPADRYQTAAAVAEALAPFCGAAVPVPAVPVSVVATPVPGGQVAAAGADSEAGLLVLLRPDAVPHRDRSASHPWAWVGAAAGILGGVLMLLLVLRLVRG